jgi:tRNA pseudouridine55 synthase
MARRKKGNPVHGWVVLDKPQGMTSTQAVGAVRRLFDAQKAGHAGTLDPLATGILPIALGEATKTVPFAVDGQKTYRFTVRWGVETDTDDAEGTVTRESAERPTRAAIESLLPQFVGEIMQVPPAFSALKIDGERAYDLARSGEAVELAPRQVLIDRLDLVDMPSADVAVFAAECGKGTYVRSLARDLGRLLGCYGHVIALRRTQVGPFGEDAAVPLEELRQAAEGDGADGAQLTDFLQPIEMALRELLEINVSQSDAARLARGQAVLLRGRDAPILGGDAFAVSKGTLIALCEIGAGELRPTRVFNYG